MNRHKNPVTESIRQTRRAASAMRQGNFKRANKAARHALKFERAQYGEA